jgi:hypothetical protein
MDAYAFGRLTGMLLVVAMVVVLIVYSMKQKKGP